jgi:hypothetical protein
VYEAVTMPKILYQSKNFGGASLLVIEQANEIIEEYQSQGFRLTLRPLYYQFVVRDLITNKVSEYKRLGGIINDGRLAGMIDWDAIEDRTRSLRSLSSWDNPSGMIETAADQFKLDLWADQDNRVEVWIEREALAGVFEGVCNKLRVPFFCCRGYTSQSEMWSAAQRLWRWNQGGQTPVILHFGDHDPSGMDMTRDITDRLELFNCPLELKRLALNMDQIRQYNPPPNPAKETDSRFQGYIIKYGDESWELDALEPQVLADLVMTLRDEDNWNDALAREDTAKQSLNKVSEKWSQVERFVNGKKKGT